MNRVVQAHGQTRVETDTTQYVAGCTIISAGPWTTQLLPTFAAMLTVRRQVLYWFERNKTSGTGYSYLPEDFPIFIWHWGEGVDNVFYGFPQIDNAGVIKVATEQHAMSTTPEEAQRNVSEAEIAAMHATHIAGKLRGIGPRSTKAVTCLYTNVPDANFIIDRLPDAPDAIVVSACSGHGFKHSAAIGEAVAQMATSGNTPEVLLPFAIKTPSALA